MFVVRQRVDGRDAGIARELLHIALRKSADDRAVNHAAQHPRGVLDGFTAAELNFIRVEKHHLPAQFADSHFKRNPRARGRFGKQQRPDFSGQWLVRMMAALFLDGRSIGENLFHVRARQFFNAQQMFHFPSRIRESPRKAVY